MMSCMDGVQGVMIAQGRRHWVRGEHMEGDGTRGELLIALGQRIEEGCR